MKMIKNKSTSYIALGCIILAYCFLSSSTAAAKLTASTSLTVVNVTEFQGQTVPGITTWAGDWPQSADAKYNSPEDQEVYLNNVHFDTNHMSWQTKYYPTPYPSFSNTVNGMVVAIWSSDKGKTFKMLSWDYLTKYTNTRHLEKGMFDCWMGTMIHTVCDRKAGECNGRNKSNVYFTEYPSGNSRCWGTVK